MNIDTVLSDDILAEAMKHVCRKKSSGYDGMTADQLPDFWIKNGDSIKKAIRKGTYMPQPLVARYIPKPGKKECRKLEIPCLTDRMLSYSLRQMLCDYYDSSFSVNSYGFRPGRGCMDALHACLDFLNNQTVAVIDLDIKGFFDHVNHPLLYRILEQDISDPAVLTLIRRYVNAKVVCNKHIYKKYIGLPQGNSASPILANVFLNSFDQFLEHHRIRFVRYADDIVLFCRSVREAEWILPMARDFLTDQLKLSLNNDKSKIIPPEQLTFLGYAFSSHGSNHYYLTINDKIKQRMLTQMKKTLSFNHLSPGDWWRRIGAFNRGWINYHIEADPHTLLTFLYQAEQNQLFWIVDKANLSVHRKMSVLRGIYDCPDYSSLTGWYLLRLSSLHISPLERSLPMTNKYTYWRSGSYYDNSDLLYSQYQNLVQKPFYYSGSNEICISHFQNYVFPNESARLSSEDYMILGILAAGKNMSFLQLQSYLLLKSILLSSEDLMKHIQKLLSLGILECNTIYSVTTQSCSIPARYLKCYRIALGGTKFVRDICAPTDYDISYFFICRGMGALQYYYINTVLCNQIILNFLLYRKSVKYFRIATSLYAKMSSNIRCKVILPLLIRTETHTYFFSIVSMSPDNRQISRIFHDWYYFQRTYEDPITFVLVANDYSSLHTAWQYLLKETVLNPRISFDHIRFSVVHSWFLPKPGILLSKDDLHF